WIFERTSISRSKRPRCSRSPASTELSSLIEMVEPSAMTDPRQVDVGGPGSSTSSMRYLPPITSPSTAFAMTASYHQRQRVETCGLAAVVARERAVDAVLEQMLDVGARRGSHAGRTRQAHGHGPGGRARRARTPLGRSLALARSAVDAQRL